MNEKKPPESFLIVRTDRLGDVVLTLPMAHAMKHAMPEARVKFLVRSYTAPIVEHCTDVDETRIAESDSSFLDLFRSFRSSAATVAFFPSPRFSLALAAFLARVPTRIGTGYRWYSFLFNRRIYEHRHTAERHEAEYNLRMLAQAGVTSEPDELPRIELRTEERMSVAAWLRENLPDLNAAFVVLHVPTGGSSHAWPTRNFIELARKITKDTGMTIIFSGLRQDGADLEVIAQEIGSGRAMVFAGHSLPELAALLDRAELVVASSTGPGHLAAAMGTRTIGLFPLPKPLSKERWGFLGPHVSNLSPPALPECPRCNDCNCMQRLDAAAVWNEVETILKNAASVSN